MDAAADNDQQLAERFVAALTARDVDAALVMVAPDVELLGWSGDEEGAAAVRAWVVQGRTTIQPLRWRRAGDQLVLEHLGTSVPRDPEYGAPHVAVHGRLALTIRNGLVTRIDPDPRGGTR